MVDFCNEKTCFTWEEDPLCFVFNDYHPSQIKMHVKRLDLQNWIKIDETYIKQMKLKEHIINKERDNIYVSRAGDDVDACKWELFEELLQYLPERYPNIFERKKDEIFNKVLMKATPTCRNPLFEDPLIRIGKLTQEDWIILQWDSEKESYVLTAGLLCFPMRWSLREKFNNSLSFIHSPVKLFMEHLALKVDNLFRTVKPDSPVWRANWGIYHDLDGPFDLYAPPPSKGFVAKYEGDVTGSKIMLRHEYQTLRRLPRTKCVVFGIRTYQRPLKEFELFPIEYSKNLLLAIEDLDEETAVYKGAPYWKEATVAYLQTVIKQKEYEVTKHLITPKILNQNWCITGGCVLGILICAGWYYFGRNKK